MQIKTKFAQLVTVCLAADRTLGMPQTLMRVTSWRVRQVQAGAKRSAI